MMRTKLAVAVIAVSLALGGLAVSLTAHHAFSAEFDPNKYVEFYGTITKVEWSQSARLVPYGRQDAGRDHRGLGV